MLRSKTFLAELLPLLVSQASNLGSSFKRTVFLSLRKDRLRAFRKFQLYTG